MRDPASPRVPHLHHWIRLAGILLASGSFFAVACLIAFDLLRGFRNPYLGILTYLVAPAFLVAGLALIAVGALWERRVRRRLDPRAVPPLPRIDLNVPGQRRTFLAVVVVTGVFLLTTAVGSYQTYQFTESNAFCGRTCHSIMTPEYTAYQQSPHARVHCVQCHIGPGASWYVKSKLSGAYQVYATLVNRYPRPIPAPIRDLRPARETCEQCHWPERFFGEVQRERTHYLADAHNSPWTIRMLVKIGGGDPANGPVGGIHWHMAIANRVEYVATDAARQAIPWVRLTDAQGRVTVYQSTTDPLPAAKVAAAQPRVMDCIDCHNRPTHIYRSPVDAVDLAMGTGRIDARLPSIKRQAVTALTAGYRSQADARAGIARALGDFYARQPSGTAGIAPAAVRGAIAAVQDIYRHNFFPAMRVKWSVYPDNAGHRESVGCFRCHDGNHRSADGRTITHDCGACHQIVAQGPAGAEESSLAGLPFRHPADIQGAWRESNCSDCHDGSTLD